MALNICDTKFNLWRNVKSCLLHISSMTDRDFVWIFLKPWECFEARRVEKPKRHKIDVSKNLKDSDLDLEKQS